MNVSVIVPMYHGDRYVAAILNQIKRNAKHASNVRLELLLYNDCPEEIIRVDETAYDFVVKVINAEKNLGIHGARVNALKQATGEYILFLDQDDVIRDNYIESQHQKIGDADAVVCRLINGGRLHYTDTFRFEEVITKDFMQNHWCPIVSPGQVLLKKESISDIWKNNTLKNNGADDYFLWLCMMAEGKKFALNQEVLFEHVITGFNVSENTNQMMDSEEEMLCILEKEQMFPEYAPKGMVNLKKSLRQILVKQLDTQRKGLICINQISRSIRKKNGIYEWIRRHRGKKVAIYGAGELGLALRDLLEEQGVVVPCYLDRNAKYIMSEIPAYVVEEAQEELDCVLITISDQKLEDRLREKFSCEVINVEQLVGICNICSNSERKDGCVG